VQLSPEDRHVIHNAIEAQAYRYEAYKRIEKETKPGLERERFKTLATINALNAAGYMSRQEALEAIADYERFQDLTAEELRTDRDHYWSDGPGADYRWLSEHAKEKKVALPSWQ
jgi:hypothetical protein